MKTKSRIVLLFAGAAMTVTAATAYAQNAGGNQPTPPNAQNCQNTPGQPCGEGPQGMGAPGMGAPGMGQQPMGKQAMNGRGDHHRWGDDDRGRQGKWGGRMASNEQGRRGPQGMDQRGMGPRGMERGEGAQMMFQRADKDNSGTVTLEEFAAASPFTFADADANGDGNITAQELADQMERQMLLRRAEAMIKRFDTDGDGQVSTAEIEKRQQEAFARIDIDGSGAIEQDELQMRRGGDRDHRGGDRGGEMRRHNGGGYGRN